MRIGLKEETNKGVDVKLIVIVAADRQYQRLKCMRVIEEEE